MTQEARIAKTSAGRRALAVFVMAGALGVTGCSSVPDALNPVEWYRGASDTVGGWFGDEETPAEPGRATAADAGSSANAAYPNLASVPPRPTPTTTAEEREALRKGLVADRANARYSGEPAAAPPTAPTTAPTTAAASAGQGASQAPAPSRQATVPPPAPEPAEPRRTARAEPTASGDRSNLWPNRPAPETPGLRASTTGRVGDSISRGAAPAPAPSPEPAASAIPERRSPAPAEQMAERTTLDSAGPAAGARAAPAEPAVGAPAPTASSQSVIVNEDAIGGGAVAASTFSGRPYLASTIYFGHGSARLTAAELNAIAEIARAAAPSGAGVQVIGHASSRTGDLSLRDHDMANFAISLKRAQAVANALIAAGMPAERVRVEAVSDTQPEYYEVMPSGEAGNRRAEIVLFY